ncbi:SDR family oxidoreductase, partial [Chryseobacterium sp. SIMBA_029]
GVGNGIGAAIARKCVAQGTTVIGCDIDGEAMGRLKREFPEGMFFSEVVDVADLSALRRFFAHCTERFDSIDGLVNNAGLYHGKSVYQYT